MKNIPKPFCVQIETWITPGFLFKAAHKIGANPRK